jgi:hypothetical protein
VLYLYIFYLLLYISFAYGQRNTKIVKIFKDADNLLAKNEEQDNDQDSIKTDEAALKELFQKLNELEAARSKPIEEEEEEDETVSIVQTSAIPVVESVPHSTKVDIVQTTKPVQTKSPQIQTTIESITVQPTIITTTTAYEPTTKVPTFLPITSTPKLTATPTPIPTPTPTPMQAKVIVENTDKAGGAQVDVAEQKSPPAEKGHSAKIPPRAPPTYPKEKPVQDPTNYGVIFGVVIVTVVVLLMMGVVFIRQRAKRNLGKPKYEPVSTAEDIELRGVNEPVDVEI